MDNNAEQFCRALVADPEMNQTRAYQTVHPNCTPASAATCATRLLKNVEVRDRIGELLRERAERLDIKADDVVRLLWATVTADPNELVEVRRDCCRHCYGEGHRYQFTPAEWEQVQRQHQQACQMAKRIDQPLPAEPDPEGGVGYDAKFLPYPECPECFGRGIESIAVKDTRTLSPAAKQLYAGAKQTRSGIEILTHSRDKSLELLGRHLAMFTDNLAHSSPDGSMTPRSLDDFYRDLNKSDDQSDT